MVDRQELLRFELDRGSNPRHKIAPKAKLNGSWLLGVVPFVRMSTLICAMTLTASPIYADPNPSARNSESIGTNAPRFRSLDEAVLAAPAVKAAEQTLLARQSAIRLMQSHFGPRLDAFAGIQDRREGPELDQGGIAGLEIRWNLWRGGGDRARLDQAKAEVAMAEMEFERQKLIVRGEILMTLGRTLMAQTLVMIEEQELTANREHSDMARRKVAAGLTSRIDQLEFELRRNEIEARLEDYRVQLQDQISHLESLGLADPKTSPALLQAWQEHLKLQPRLQDSIEIAAAEPAVLIQQLQTAAAKSNRWGELDVLASAGRLRAGEHRRDFDDRHYELRLRIPLWSSGQIFSQTNQAQALAAREESRLTERRRLKQIERLDLERQLMSIRRLRELAQTRAQRAQAYFDMTIAEYRRGIKNSPDLASASELLFEAQKHRAEIELRLGEVLAKALAF